MDLKISSHKKHMMTFGRDLEIRIADADKARLKIMLLAKHATSGGRASAVDGNHAIYHHEVLTTLREIGLQVEAAITYDNLATRPDVDFIFPLLNRGGFLNSEMLAPLLATRYVIPFLGASPIIRGLADDKHLCKLAARSCGVPTMPWTVLRRGGIYSDMPFTADRYVVKPNASSASWGIGIANDWPGVRAMADKLHQEGHDVLVEAWAPQRDVAVPVIGGAGGKPYVLPAILSGDDDPLTFRTYEEKRGLVLHEAVEHFIPVENEALQQRFTQAVERLLPEFWPFDYGRFEFRYDPSNGDIQFMELNLSCNLWSRKTISRSAAYAGIDHASLLETILGHSMMRQGVISQTSVEIAA